MYGLNLEDIDHKEIKSNKRKGNATYVDIECAFDVETTSTIVDGEKVGFMYAWTFGIKNNENIVHGRTWKQFRELVNYLQKFYNLKEDRRLIVYIHNLSYEFQFMRKWFTWKQVFGTDSRKPITATTKSGIEFRDSYILSGKSLSDVADSLVHHEIKKLKGELDYTKVRHQNTVLFTKELEYMRNDVLIILYYINEQRRIYGNISKIPLTNTARVRNYIRHNCYYTNTDHKKTSRGKRTDYRNLMLKLQLTRDVYEKSKDGFMGGFTHANPSYANEVIEDVASYDLISSYPAAMLSEQFPMSEGISTKLTKDKDLNHYIKQGYALLFDVRFKDLISKIDFENYISESKCHVVKKPIVNNGRVFSADELVTTITDVDFEIIQKVYDWESMQIANVYRFKKDYLPRNLIKSIITLYEKKTINKGVPDRQTEYLLSKEMLNSVYGMTVTDVVRKQPDFEETEDIEEETPDKQIEKYNTKHSRFLYYPWGVWTTAYARRNLWVAILNLKDDYVYSDTDAVKLKEPEKHEGFFEQYNKMIEMKLKKMVDTLNKPVSDESFTIDFERLRPENKYGEKKLIGTWELDGKYSRFKALGAKQYLVEDKATGDLEMTLAGLSKDKGLSYLQRTFGDNTNVFNNFNKSLSIPAEDTGNMNHVYIDDIKQFVITDYRGVKEAVYTKSGIHLENAEFTLSPLEKQTQLIERYRKGYIYEGEKLTRAI